MYNEGNCPDAQAGLRLCCSQTPKAAFFVSRPIYQFNLYHIFRECSGSVVEYLCYVPGVTRKEFRKPKFCYLESQQKALLKFNKIY